MPIRYHIWPDARFGLAVAHETVRGSDVVGAMRTLFMDPAWQPGFDLLWDARRVETLLLAPEDAEEVVGATRELGERMGAGRSAVVVYRFLDYANARLLSARNKSMPGRDIRLFYNLDEALQWLGVSPDMVAGYEFQLDSRPT